MGACRAFERTERDERGREEGDRVRRVAKPTGTDVARRMARTNGCQRLLDCQHADLRDQLQWGLVAVVCCLTWLLANIASVATAEAD